MSRRYSIPYLMLSKIVSSVSTALDFNQATLSGCIDIIVVQQEDATLK